LRFPLDRNNKIAGAIAMDMGEISWVSAFLPRDLYVAGRVGGAINIRGALAKPEFYGAMTANHLALTLASEGIFWPEGHLKTSWRNNEIHLDELVFEDSEKGKLQAQGQAVIDNGIRFSSKIFLSHFKVLERPDRFVVASCNVSLEGTDQGLGATGKITIDKADINIATPEGVTYASDVVVKGEKKPAE
jgi:autotransporter translocation and assembly factor TamB